MTFFKKEQRVAIKSSIINMFKSKGSSLKSVLFLISPLRIYVGICRLSISLVDAQRERADEIYFKIGWLETLEKIA